ncbi:sugar phosphate isomerase/epimerase family protein [Actinopolymorpha pittospori]
MTIRLAAQEHMLDGATLVEKFRFAQACGFDGIELRGAGKGWFGTRVEEVRSARAAGVVMPTVCVMMDHFIGDFDAARRKDAREQMKILLSVIVEAGGFGAVTPASYGMFSLRLPPFEPPRTAEQDREILLEELTALGEHARDVGAVVLLEPLNRYEDHMVNTLAAGAGLVREVGLASVALIGDFFHMSIEESDPAQALRDVAPHLRHLQLGDTNRLEPGAGHYDWARSLDALEEIGYDGWMAMECRLSGPPSQVLPRVSALLRRPAGADA